jgi:hypothetical protein
MIINIPRSRPQPPQFQHGARDSGPSIPTRFRLWSIATSSSRPPVFSWDVGLWDVELGRVPAGLDAPPKLIEGLLGFFQRKEKRLGVVPKMVRAAWTGYFVPGLHISHKLLNYVAAVWALERPMFFVIEHEKRSPILTRRGARSPPISVSDIARCFANSTAPKSRPGQWSQRISANELK